MALRLSSGLARTTLISMVGKRRKGEKKMKKGRREAGKKGEGGTEAAPMSVDGLCLHSDQLWEPVEGPPEAERRRRS